MQSLTTSERIMNVLAQVTGTDDVRALPDVRLFDRGYLDSLGAVELLVELSDEFGVSLSPTELDREEWATPARIVRYLEQRLGV
jgi:D-alanine--poly(phosphoribitol) ligase subunit 2